MYVLAVIEDPYRGVIERRYADCFYLARVLGAQLGRLDVVLRGDAVLLASTEGDVATAGIVTAGSERWDGDLANVIKDDAGLYVDRQDAAQLGITEAQLIDGARMVDGSPRPWAQYSAVWFL
jgi:hypothetical protein